MPVTVKILEHNIACTKYQGIISTEEMIAIVQGKVETEVVNLVGPKPILIVDFQELGNTDELLGYLGMHLASVTESMQEVIVIKPADPTQALFFTGMLASSHGLNLKMADNMAAARVQARNMFYSNPQSLSPEDMFKPEIIGKSPRTNSRKKWWEFWK